MLIHEAVHATTREKPNIRRTSWHYHFLLDLRKAPGLMIRVLPTNSPDCTLVFSPIEGCTGKWSPTRDDLLADDWEPVP